MLMNYETEFSREFTNRVISCYKKMRFIGAMILGGFGIGKTSAAMQLALDVYHRLYPEKDEDELEQMVLDSMLYSLDDVHNALFTETKKIDWNNISPLDAIKIQRKIRKPIYIWDDAATHGSTYKRTLDNAYDIQRSFDQIKDATSCMIVTLPEAEEILRTIRNYRSFLRAEPILLKNHKNMKLMFQKKKRHYNGQLRWVTEWYSNERPVKIDDDWYGSFLIKRNIAKIKNDEEAEKRKKFKQQYEEYINLKRIYMKKKMLGELEKIGFKDSGLV